MSPAQARALLELLADLYQLASAPEPVPEPVPEPPRANHKVTKEATRASS